MARGDVRSLPMSGVNASYLRVVGPEKKAWHEWGPAAICVARTGARNLCFPLFGETVCKQVFTWAGYLARAQTDNLVVEVVSWRWSLCWTTC